jgi:hypothetical protein
MFKNFDIKKKNKPPKLIKILVMVDLEVKEMLACVGDNIHNLIWDTYPLESEVNGVYNQGNQLSIWYELEEDDEFRLFELKTRVPGIEIDPEIDYEIHKDTVSFIFEYKGVVRQIRAYRSMSFRNFIISRKFNELINY